MQRENKNKHQTSAIMKGEVKDEGCSKKNKTDRKLFKKNNKEICRWSDPGTHTGWEDRCNVRPGYREEITGWSVPDRTL